MLIMNILERTSYIKQAGIMHKKREESKNLLIKAASSRCWYLSVNAGADTRKRQSIRGIRFYKRQLWRYISSVCEADTLYCKKYKIYSDTRLFFEVEDETGKQSACKAA